MRTSHYHHHLQTKEGGAKPGLGTPLVSIFRALDTERVFLSLERQEAAARSSSSLTQTSGPGSRDMAAQAIVQSTCSQAQRGTQGGVQCQDLHPQLYSRQEGHTL